jgi:hypothetical protein
MRSQEVKAMTRSSKSFPVLFSLSSILSVPLNFLFGFVVGLIAPVAAIAAMVFGVRFLTGRLPFLNLEQFEEDGERRMSLELVPEEQARDLFAVEKQTILDEVAGLQQELKAAMQEAQEKA